jgi:hypothetical protein
MKVRYTIRTKSEHVSVDIWPTVLILQNLGGGGNSAESEHVGVDIWPKALHICIKNGTRRVNGVKIRYSIGSKSEHVSVDIWHTVLILETWEGGKKKGTNFGENRLQC